MNFSNIRLRIVKTLVDINEKIFFESRLKRFYQSQNHRKINTVVDVGANKGQSIDIFLSLNPDCRIYAIEANPALCELLRKRYSKSSNVKIFQIGISDHAGKKMFYENVLDYTSSFEALNEDSDYLKKKAQILGVTSRNIIKKQYSVDVMKLDDFIKSNVQSDIDVLKIDTEGHEYYCLAGLFGSKIPFNIHFIQLEQHHDDMYLNPVDFGIIDELLAQHNYHRIKVIGHGFGSYDEVVYECSHS